MAVVIGSSKNDKIVPGKLSQDVVVESGDFSTGAEADDIVGGLGNDTIESGAAVDLVLGDLDGAQVSGDKAGADKIKGQDENDILVGDSAELASDAKGGKDTINGNDGDDRIHGDALSTMTDATGGDDKLYGDKGNDILIGDAVIVDGGKGGKDTLDGGDGDDWLYGDAGTASDVDKFDLGNLLGSAKGGDDTLKGRDGNDFLFGDAIGYSDEAEGGKDKLFGDDGDDWLDGGRGKDDLNGGKGDDIFFIGLHSGKDTIKDFDKDKDLLDWSELFEASGKTTEEIFGNNDKLDSGDKHVKQSGNGLKIDIGQLFELETSKDVDTLVLNKLSSISLDQVITTA